MTEVARRIARLLERRDLGPEADLAEDAPGARKRALRQRERRQPCTRTWPSQPLVEAAFAGLDEMRGGHG